MGRCSAPDSGGGARVGAISRGVAPSRFWAVLKEGCEIMIPGSDSLEGKIPCLPSSFGMVLLRANVGLVQ